MSSLGGSCSVGNVHAAGSTVSIVSSTLERGLRQPDHLRLVADRHRVHRVGPVDQLHVLGRLSGGALDFLVALVADQQDVEVVAGEALGFLVHLGDQRAGGVDGAQVPLRGGSRARSARHRARRTRPARPPAPRRSRRRRPRPAHVAFPRRAGCARSPCARRSGRRASREPSPRSRRRGRRLRSSRAARPAARACHRQPSRPRSA